MIHLSQDDIKQKLDNSIFHLLSQTADEIVEAYVK